MKYFWLFLCFIITNSFVAQTKIKGQIIDFDSKVPIAFATITYNNTKFNADWEGKFSVVVKDFKLPIKVNFKGYYEKITYPQPKVVNIIIKLVNDLNEKKAEIYTENGVNNIVKKVIEHRKTNDPEKALSSFQYKNYEYVQVTANPDSISSKIDTIYKKRLFRKTLIKLDSSNYRFKKFSERQHLYQTEKVNLIQHNQNQSKETVLATRMAGFEQPVYEYLGLKLISYSVYENPFEILEIPVQNPISNFGRNLYNYKLIDTVKIGDRSAYRIYFEPKKLNANRLRGLLYIDTVNFGRKLSAITFLRTLHLLYKYFSPNSPLIDFIEKAHRTTLAIVPAIVSEITICGCSNIKGVVFQLVKRKIKGVGICRKEVGKIFFKFFLMMLKVCKCFF